MDELSTRPPCAGFCHDEQSRAWVYGSGFWIHDFNFGSSEFRFELYTTLPSEDPSYYTRLL